MCTKWSAIKMTMIGVMLTLLGFISRLDTLPVVVIKVAFSITNITNHSYQSKLKLSIFELCTTLFEYSLQEMFEAMIMTHIG